METVRNGQILNSSEGRTNKISWLGVMLKRNRRVKSLELSWKKDLLFTQMGRTWKGQVGVGDIRIKSSVLDVLSVSCLLDIQVEIQDK